MKIGSVADSLAYFPLDELLDTLAGLGVAGSRVLVPQRATVHLRRC